MKYARLEKIKKILLEQKHIDVITLAKMLGASEVTIRSDLCFLESEGFVYRTHGGAVLRATSTLISLGDKLAINFSPEKLAIGTTAAELIAQDEWIFLGSGTTCAAIAYALQNRAGVNVVTNSLYVALLLSQNKASNVIMASGQLQHERLMLGGELFSRSFVNLFVSKAFFGVSAVDINMGYFVSQDIEISIFKTVKSIASEAYIVTDSQKFGKHSLTCSGPLNIVDHVICDNGMPAEFREKYEQLGVKMHFPPDPQN